MLRKVGGLFRQGTTAIRSTRSDNSRSHIYTLNGTRRDTLQHGINIVDGKKVIR